MRNKLINTDVVSSVVSLQLDERLTSSLPLQLSLLDIVKTGTGAVLARSEGFIFVEAHLFDVLRGFDYDFFVDGGEEGVFEDD